MIITNKFVFLHLPKTGGTFVTEILKKISKTYSGLKVKEHISRKHQGVKNIPSEAKNLPVVTSVRNPFDHYVSRYTFRWWRRENKKHYRPDLIKKKYPNFPDLNFSEFLRYRCDWDIIPLTRFKDTVVRENVRNILNKNRFGFGAFELVDLISHNTIEVISKVDSFCESDSTSLKNGIIFLDQATLSKDLFKILCAFDVPEDVAAISLRSGKILPKFNEGINKKGCAREYYSRKDVDFVLDRDRLIFHLFQNYRANENIPFANYFS